MNLVKERLQNKKYDIVFVTEFFVNDKFEYFYGGAEIHLKNICDILKDNKKILVIQSTKSYSRFITKDKIDILLLHSQGYHYFMLKIRSILSKVNTNVIHFNYLDLITLVKKKKEIIYTATFHGTEWDFPTKDFDNVYVKNNVINKLGSYLLKKIMIIEQNIAIKKLDKILSVDTSLLRYTQQFLTSYRNKISTIFNFVDLTKFRNKESTIKNNSNNFVILYPRNISYARGVHFLVPIVKILKEENLNFVIKIIGAGIKEIKGDKYELTLYDDIKKNKLENYFEFLGRVPHEQMPSLFQDCNLVLIPTFFSEGTSLSCLESMASKRIVLATNIGGLNDLIIDGYNGFLSRPLSEDIAKKIIFIIKNYKKIEFIKKNAYDIVSNVYSHENWKIKIIKYFSDLERSK